MAAVLALASQSLAGDISAREIVRQALDHWRGVSSVGEMDMTIHRADWERSMSIKAWTQGTDKSLVRITAPHKDRGNGTLMLNNSMWSYSPKIKRVIRIPSSMMGQSWMGSDFSNKDVSRSDDIVDQYTHRILETRLQDGNTIYVIESVPLEDAAIVWGREVLVIRDDWVILEQTFYDQDDVLIQKLDTLEVGIMGGRVSALRQRMGKVDAPDEWTELQVTAMQYDVDIDDRIFTVANLKNPRE
jgi:outer membrane lipoprotein-sorting protein